MNIVKINLYLPFKSQGMAKTINLKCITEFNISTSPAFKTICQGDRTEFSCSADVNSHFQNDTRAKH